MHQLSHVWQQPGPKVLTYRLLCIAMATDGERILVLQRSWMDLILSGRKTIEVRGVRLRAGAYLIGCKSIAYGRVRFGKAFEVKDDAEWQALRQQHMVKSSTRPYRHTWALPIESVEIFEKTIQYQHPRGAVGIVIYRACERS